MNSTGRDEPIAIERKSITHPLNPPPRRGSGDKRTGRDKPSSLFKEKNGR
jgi:hypothetical protein